MHSDKKSTILSRINIGFINIKERWPNEEIKLTNTNLEICGHPVMESWEDSYMKSLAKIATKNKGIVLELGFGMGISASYIQKYSPNKHIIIEANKNVATTAVTYFKNSNYPVYIIQDFWEQATKLFCDSSIDGILFDTYPLSKEDIHKNHFLFFKEAFRLLKPNGIFTYYSDEIKWFSDEHINELKKAGFYKINGEICTVKPPEDCLYWKHNTILAPIIIK